MLSLLDDYLLTCPTVIQPYCVRCGSTNGIEQHHVVPRARTQKGKSRGPTVSFCKACHTHHHSVRPFAWYYDEGWTCDGKPCHTEDYDPA